MLGKRLYTRRLIMRRVEEVDLPLILAWSHSDAASGPYLTPERFDAETLREIYLGNSLWNRHDKTLLIALRPTGEPIGTIHFWLRQTQAESAVISVKIAAVHERGKGYGTEAQKYLVMHLFSQVGVKAVEMYTDIDNLAQQRCLTKLGFHMAESLTYDDRHVVRTGVRFQLTEADFRKQSIYRFHYE